MRPREPESTHVASDVSSPRVALKAVGAWCSSPETPGTAGSTAPWTTRLRVLLPDAASAPAAARREALWQRCSRGGSTTESGATLVSVIDIKAAFLRVVSLDGLFLACSNELKRGREHTLADAVQAAAERSDDRRLHLCSDSRLASWLC